MGSATWAMNTMDLEAVDTSLARMLVLSGAHGAMVVHRSGQFVTSAGKPLDFDTTSFATLAAADFGANDQIARLIGEPDFSSLVHEGEKESLFVTDIAHRLLLVVLFDRETTLALVRMMAPAFARELALLFDSALRRDEDDNGLRLRLLEGAEHEIDSLFH